MRKLYSFEEPVLPVGMQNLETGNNADFNVFNSWGAIMDTSVSLINLKGSFALILSGHAKNNGVLVHDQTHRIIGNYRHIAEFKGTYPNIFKQIMRYTHKKSIRAYVYK